MEADHRPRRQNLPAPTGWVADAALAGPVRAGWRSTRLAAVASRMEVWAAGGLGLAAAAGVAETSPTS